jgi:hypothetical protein
VLRVFGAIPTEEYIGFPIAESEGAVNVRTANIAFVITNCSV